MSASRIGTLAVALVIAGGCANGTASPVAPGPPAAEIVIASNLSSSYPQAHVAELAIRLAVARHPRIGRFKLGLWSLDDSVATWGFPEKGIQNVNQMIDDPSVLGMVGPGQSYMAVVEIPVANLADLVMISPSATNTCLTQAVAFCKKRPPKGLRPTGRNNFFRLPPTDPVQGLAMARYVAVNLGIKKVAVINEFGPGGDDIEASFAHELSRQGGTVVMYKSIAPPDPGTTTNYSEFLGAAHDRGAEAIYAIGAADICAARAQMKDNTLFLGTDGFSTDPDCVTEAGDRSESILATWPDVDVTASHDPQAMAAVRDFHETYPHVDIAEYTFAAYDAAEILIAAIEKAVQLNGGALPNRRDVLNAMQDISYPGLTGNISFDQNGDALSPLMSLYQVHNGSWEYVQRLDASPTP